METVLENRWGERRKDGYDVVVVGSGYGGAITAARLANANLSPKLKACILERGKEWPIGDFPDSLWKVLASTYNEVFNPLGLYEFDAHRDIAVIRGGGLGGTSLINANVAIRPDPDIFKAWPSPIYQAAQIEEGQPESLWSYYGKAEETLDVSPHPEGHALKKIQALGKRAAQLNKEVELLRIAVHFKDQDVEVYRRNGKSIVKHKCDDCGDCVTGCNEGAKNTLYMNYLPLAKKGGADIFTQTEVEYIEKAQDGGWIVHVIHRENNLVSTKTTIRAGAVILAAGSLGSTEILLRSEQHGLTLGAGVGTRFSGNGDFFGLAYNSDQITDVLGWGHPGDQHEDPNHEDHHEDPISKKVRPGPSIVGIIRYNRDKPVVQRFSIEDVSFPRAYTDAAAAAFRVIKGADTDPGVRDEDQERERRNKDIWGAHPEGALNSTMLYLSIGHDDAGGTMYLDQLGKLRIDWLGAGRQELFKQMNKECFEHAKALGASFIENPLWQVSPWQTLLTAHPLGGCPIGEEGSDGAVDHLGRVFSGMGTEVHEGFYVADGAIIRTALGVNPFLTISALAERIADHIILQKKGMGIEEKPPTVAVPALKDLDPVATINFREEQLERVFQQADTLRMDKLVNTGQHAIDWENRRIHNDHFWKGFFPKGHVLNTLSSLFFTGFKKRFFKDGSRVKGVTSDSDGRINARNVLDEITLNKKKGDLKRGKYILLRYPDPPWQLYYDVLKIINQDLLIGRAYFGVFPHGIKIMTFPMLRVYDFDHMGVDDFQKLYDGFGVQPDPAMIEGIWDMNAIANSNHSQAVARLAFESKPDGRFEARFQFLNIFEGLSTARFTGEQLELYDFTSLHDEIRMLSPDFMVGKWATRSIKAYGPFYANSTGLIHTERQADGSKRFSLYYTLKRSTEVELPPPFLAERILREPVAAGITFEEKMVGDFYPGEKVERDTDIGKLSKTKGKGIECSFRLKMIIEDLDAFVESSDHRAQPVGTIHFGEFAGGKDVTYDVQADPQNTFFDYLRENPGTKEREMRYSLKFTAGNDKTYLLWGLKFMQRNHQGNVQEILDDYTTLYTRIYELNEDGGRQKEVGAALLKFRIVEDIESIASFMKFLLSFEVIGTNNPFKKIQARNKFNVFTLHFIFREYDPIGSGLAGIG
jgi:cholesterol oxidase